MEINTILSQIDLGSYAMPVFQRGYVWNRDQVRKLMNSLYKGYPIGELLVWNTATDPGISRGDGPLTPGNVNLILDGQQTISLERIPLWMYIIFFQKIFCTKLGKAKPLSIRWPIMPS